MTRIPNALNLAPPAPRVPSPLSASTLYSGETDSFELSSSGESTVCGSPKSRTSSLGPLRTSSPSRDVARQLVDRAAPYLWSGDLDEAEAIVTVRDATAHSTPEARTELEQFRATLHQFKGSAALKQGDSKSPLFFIRAQAALVKASVDGNKIEDAERKRKALTQVEFQFLLIERAIAGESVDEALRASFEQILPKLAGPQFDQNAGLVFHILGEHAKAKEKWLSLLAARHDDYASRLVLCRLGMTENALGNYESAAKYLERGLFHLPSFPERDVFQSCYESARARKAQS